jgi:rfaE bifunctional protein nucleotidyltransferase chain/domain
MSEIKNFRQTHIGKKIVFTNGCFDIIHRGHVSYLNEAKSLGDLLVVGLNSDNSVRKLKGPDRPVNLEQDRKFVMQNLKAVDAVFIFDTPTPLELILELRPDVVVKGGDWKIDQIVGAKEVLAWGGEAYSLNFVDGYSTTSTIQKIQK